jgi:hypothetical protein
VVKTLPTCGRGGVRSGNVQFVADVVVTRGASGSRGERSVHPGRVEAAWSGHGSPHSLSPGSGSRRGQGGAQGRETCPGFAENASSWRTNLLVDARACTAGRRPAGPIKGRRSAATVYALRRRSWGALGAAWADPLGPPGLYAALNKAMLVSAHSAGAAPAGELSAGPDRPPQPRNGGQIQACQDKRRFRAARRDWRASRPGRPGACARWCGVHPMEVCIESQDCSGDFLETSGSLPGRRGGGSRRV